MGLSRHFDDLMIFNNNKDNRLGFSMSFGINYRINNKINYFVDSEFEFEELHVASYISEHVSRHQKYLSGHKFNTGGLSINTGLSF